MNVLTIAGEARLGLHGRILRCPLGDSTATCPLNHIRELPVQDRIEWLDSRSDAEVIELFSYHNNCQEERLLLDLIKQG